MKGKEPALRGYDAYKAKLKAGQNVSFRESGNSMKPRILHRQECTYTPVTSHRDVQKGDCVWCKVKGRYYTHLVSAKKAVEGGFLYQISNNHGHVNGWIPLESIFGKVVAIEGKPV
ncbi:MAG TPA: hypothetical protein VHE55_15180 [Fimbriimonadaceae bacterium]|nr:hypothetical protein [Fimbriimonadaceae bacterium]